MHEKIFNLFYFVRTGAIVELGAVVHEHAGTDSQKNAFLQTAVIRDFPHSKRYPLPKVFSGLTTDGFFALTRLGRHLEVFVQVFDEFDAPARPLCCVTPIVDDQPMIDLVCEDTRFSFTPHQGHPKVGLGTMSDYLDDYMTTGGLDIPRLINDDYFNAIRLLFNHRSWVSCMKLLASFVDTVAFLEFGDVSGNFQKWLDTYANMQRLGITSAQLWEMRNSLLHMSNLDSRKVLSGREKRVGFCVGPKGMAPMSDIACTYFNLNDLIEEIAAALSVWVDSLNHDRAKFLRFVERYDRIISDARPSRIRP